MRIAVLNWTNRVAGGTEEYLRRFLPAASAAGHRVAFLYEVEGPEDRAAIHDPPGGVWSVERLGADAAATAVRDWRPDVLYAHGFGSPALEARLYELAPTVFFAHEYYGTCISGTKTTRLPVLAPCERTFGPACLAHYFPRRCGGLNPVTMWRQYRLQADRLAALRRCSAVVTHSEHMREEYVRHGFAPDRVAAFPYYVLDEAPEAVPARPLPERPTLTFLGRMEANKGGAVLLAALPEVRRRLGRQLRVVFAGDGRDRTAWEAQARPLQGRDPGLRVEFAGWVDAAGRSGLLQATDLLVVPSLWPEPFGRVGPEAGRYGVPAVAFDLGGTPSWLTDGENGYLARGRPPTDAALADAIVRCLADPAAHARLRAGAATLASRFTWEVHFAALMRVLRRAAGRRDDTPVETVATFS